MRALVQRVSRASVGVGGEVVGAIGRGVVILAAVAAGDAEEDVRWLADRVANLRIFSDEAGRFERSALQVGAECLLVSQFTLYADTRKGRRPSFVRAAPPEQAASMLELLEGTLRRYGLTVRTGRFQEHMAVELVNDGPVTIWLDSADRLRPRSSA